MEEWKPSLRARIANERTTGRRPAVRLHITLGSVALAAVVGTVRGRVGWGTTVAALGSMLLAQELPRALFARGIRRSSRVRLSATGGDTAVSGEPLRGIARLIFTTIGSATNVLVGAAALSIGRHGLEPDATAFVRTLAFSHLAWGVAQLLPVVPFRIGMAVSARLAPSDTAVRGATL